MSIVSGILEEELKRLDNLQSKYSANLASLPKGALRKRKIGQKVYLYLIFRKGGHVVTDYLCQEGTPEAARFEKQDAKRRELKSKMKKVKEDLAEIRKCLGKLNHNQKNLTRHCHIR